jgi:DedD protein
MRLFSRNKEVVEAPGADDVPFESLRRSPRNTRKSRAAIESYDTPPPLDPAETSKTRARRRLIGAIALALAAIVFVPMLFDRTPVPPPDDMALQIPDRDAPFEGRRGVPDPGKSPLKAAGDLPTVATPTSVTPVQPAPESTTTSPVAVVTTPKVDLSPVESTAQPVETAKTAPAPKIAEKATPTPVEKAPEKAKPTTASPTTAPTAASDDPRAIAALEGKADAATPAADASGKTYAVQIAAYSAAEKARAMRDQLTANGFKSYTESVSTTQGLRIRVRLGPFTSREAADRAKQKLKTMKLDGSVVPL